MDLFVCWVLYPALYLLVALGLGLLVERASGDRLPGVLILPVGLAGVFAVTQILSYYSWSAPATTPGLLVLGAAGLVSGRRRVRVLWRARPDRAALAAAVVVFAVFGAPIVLTGEPTFAGYTVLGDTSIHFIGADYILHHGRHIGGLPPSSYEFSLESYYGNGGYPSGGPTAAGAMAEAVGENIAWVFQPFLALLAAMTSLCVYALIARRVRPAWLRFFVAALAPQSALVLAYALQGSVKEVGTAWAIVVLVAVAALFAEQCTGGWRRVIPLAVAAAAGMSLISLSIAPWLGVVLAAALVAAVRGRGIAAWRGVLLQSGAFVVVTAALSFPALAVLGTFLPSVTATVTAPKEYGNLLGPLDPIQMFGTYLTGDYRVKPDTASLLMATYLLIGASLVAAGLGLVWALRRRAWALLYIAVSLIGWYYVTRNGSPWAQAKALMIVSPAVMVAIALGPVGLYEAGRRVEAGALATVVAVGVLWSNALAYHDVSNAPWSRMVELERVGQRIAGQGPTLYTEFEEFGKHFLAAADPESPGEGWQRRLALAAQTTDGTVIHQGQSYDLDSFTPAYVDYYRTIVLRLGPAWSRPPSIYDRVWTGRYYAVWQRPAGSEGRIIAHLPLGSLLSAAAVPSCPAVAGLAREALAAHGRLAYTTAPTPLVIIPTHTAYPPKWAIDPSDPLSLVPTGPGKVVSSVLAPTAGTYDIWLGGSIGRPFRVYVDGAYLGSVANQLEGRGEAVRAGAVSWRPGRHVIVLIAGGGSLDPGNGQSGRRLGPISAVMRQPDSGVVRYLGAGDWHTLCGRPADWIEAVR
ncbi:MAG TPA: hypothetical protein VFR49_03560 [Solirubrobacteraceae bacterium]|nr:hypothetical protein [Solirubrobacteraceae bacterium]